MLPSACAALHPSQLWMFHQDYATVLHVQGECKKDQWNLLSPDLASPLENQKDSCKYFMFPVQHLRL